MPLPNCVIRDASASIVWSDPAVPESLLRDIATNPVKLVRAAACHPVKIGRESLIVQSEWPVGDRSMLVAIKQYRPRTLGKALAAVFRPAKAMRELAQGRVPAGAGDCHAAAVAGLPAAWLDDFRHQLSGHRLDRRRGEPASFRLANRRPAAGCATSPCRAMCRGPGPAARADACRRRGPSRSQGRQSARGRRRLRVRSSIWSISTGCVPARQVAFQATSPRSGAAGGWIGRASLGDAVDRPAFSPCIPAGISRGGTDWKPLWRAIAEETAKYVRRKQKRGEKVL